MAGPGSFLGNYFLAKVSLSLVHDLRVALFNKLLVLPNRYFDNHNSGHLISRITFNVTMVTGAATDAIKVVIREGLTVVFLFAYLLWMNWHLTLVMVAILPVIAVMVSIASKKFRKQSKKIQVAMGDVTHVASETIQGYRVVRSFGGEAYEQQRFGQASQSNTDKQLRMTKTGSLYTPMLQLVIYSAMAALMFLVLFLRGESTAGDLVAYITAAGLLPKPIRQLSEVSSTIQKGLAGAESIFEQLDEAPEVDTGTVEKERVEGRLEVRNLSFTYPGTEREVLSDISFVAEPGQMIALVGRSGSGKSTLAALFHASITTTRGRSCSMAWRSSTIACATCVAMFRKSPSMSPCSTTPWPTTSRMAIWPARRAQTSKPPRPMPMPRNSSTGCQRASIPKWVRTVYCFPGASASAWQLPVRCLKTRRC